MADNQSAAFGVFPQMKPRRSAQDREAAKNIPVDVARGFVSGVAGMPGDLESIARLLLNIQGPERFVMPKTKEEGMAMLGQIFGANRVGYEAALPTSEDIEKRLPFKGTGPTSEAFTGMGQLAGGFYTGPGAPIRLVTGIPQAVVKAGKDFVVAAGKPAVAMKTYHGSKHRFPPTPKNELGEFDPIKIGTGEGAQSYGYGHYLAEAPDVAKTYQPRSPEFEGKLLDLYQKAQSTRNYPMMEVLEDAMLHRSPSEIVQKFSSVDDGYTAKHLKAAQDFAKWYSRNQPEVGGLYTVDLPDEKIARMLDWDKPLSQQSEAVRNALSGLPFTDDVTGQKAYEWLQQIGGGTKDRAQAFASKRLQEQGISGIRYLDQGPQGEGTSNFVVFPGEEGALTILERNKEGGAVHKAGGGALVKAIRAAQKIAPVEAPAVVIPSAITRVQQAVRESKGDYGAKRVQRAADEVKNLEKLYKEEALRQAFTGDNAQAMMTINPADFERFALELIKSKGARSPSGAEIDKYSLPTDEYIQYLQRLRGGFDDVPFLGINKDEAGLPIVPFISGHEGRHRSRALAASGQPTSIVRLVPRAELREPFPRRSQEEYIEALRKELELTDNMIIPEGDLNAYRSGEGPPPRPAIKLPQPYAKGGLSCACEE